MKKTTNLILATLALGALSTSTQVFADDSSDYKSNGLLEFIPNDTPTDPKDPLDPEEPVLPIDPTDPDGPAPGTNGPLSIDYASSLDFGRQKISSSDQIYYATSQKYQTADGQEKEGPNYVQVTDNRGTEAGWTLTVKQSGQFISESGKELTGAQITFTNGNVVSNSQSGKPVGNQTIILNTDGSESKVMEASVGTGAGTFLYDWGTDAATGANSIKLSVPGSTTKYAEKYTTKLNWNLTDVPGN